MSSSGVYVAFPTGAHLNPAVTVAIWMTGGITAKQALVYFCAEFLGAFIGAILAWLAFRDHFDAEEDPGKKLGVFSTGPAIRSYGWNVVTEVIATFVLIFWVLISGGTPAAIGALGRRARRGRYRRIARWPDRVRHQPGP